MLVDTDILIWYLRGNDKAKHRIESLEDFSISAITQMELIQGVRNKNELQALRSFVRDWDIKVVLINESICNRALFYMEEHYLNYNLRMADSLIAATAVMSGNKLLTGNSKHYKMIKDLSLESFKL